MHAALDFIFCDTSPDVLSNTGAHELTSGQMIPKVGSSLVGSRDCMSLEYIIGTSWPASGHKRTKISGNSCKRELAKNPDMQ